MGDEQEHRNDGRAFRWVVGMLVLATAVAGFAALFYLRVPPENKDAMMFALGAIFGWAGAVVSSEYGVTTTGRKVAESVVRQIERQDLAPTGSPTDPIAVAGAETDAAPVKTTEGKDKA